MHIHEIRIDIQNPAQILITGREQEKAILTVGEWPELQKLTPRTEISLANTRFIYLDWEGRIVSSFESLSYGWSTSNSKNEMLDLLAWQEDEEWHIKKLLPEFPS